MTALPRPHKVIGMDYRSLGRTGTQVSAYSVGTMNFGRATDAAESARIIDRAIDLGVNFIDTADVYGSPPGSSEEFVGAALAANGKRDRLVVATKVWGLMDPTDPNGRGISRRAIIKECDASLRRLRTDWIDLYQIHRPDSKIPIDEILRALDDLVTAGKVRYIGSSTFPAWKVVEALWAAREFGTERFVTEQPPYHLLDRRIERELVPMAQSFGIGILPWSCLAQGFLAGKYRRGQQHPAGSRFADPAVGEGWQKNRITEANPGVYTEEAFRVLDVVDELAREKSCTASQLALAWTAAQPGITSVILGPRTLAQAEDNLGAVDVVITAEDCARLDAVAPPESAVLPYWIADFGPNLGRW